MEGSGAGSHRSQVQSILFAGVFVFLNPHAIPETGLQECYAEIAAAEEALACAHKALQDLKVKRQLVLSFSTVPAIFPESS